LTDNNCLQWPPIDDAVASVAEDRFYHMTSVVSVVAHLMTMLNYSNHLSGNLMNTSSIRSHPSTLFRLRYSVGLGQWMTSFMKTHTSQTYNLRQSGSSLLHTHAVAVAD